MGGWRHPTIWVIGFFLLIGILLVLIFVVFQTNELSKRPSKEATTCFNFSRVSVLIVPHHLVADSFIDAAFQRVSKKIDGNAVNRVILLSPNHFGVGRDWIVGANQDWETPSGTLKADTGALWELRDSVFIGDTILDREHGVRNIFPFIKKYFPRATVVPLVLHDGLPHEESDDLAERLSMLSDTHTLLVVSADFSHYLDWNFSRFHDDEAIEVLSHNELSRVDTLDVDCSVCLRVAMEYASLRNASNFQLLSRSSSLSMLGSNIVGSETSHITGYFSSEESLPENDGDSAKLLFSGDILPWRMTEASRRIFMAQDGDIFEENGKTNVGVFRPDSEEMMSDVEQVVEPGKPFSTRTIDGNRVTFIDAGIESRSPENRVQDIGVAKEEGGRVIVLWGNSFFSLDIARMYIVAGADLVIGKDQASIESTEVYRGKFIFPSLGSVSPNCQSSSETCLEIILGVDFSRKNMKYVFMPVRVNSDGQVALATGDKRKESLEKLSEHVSDPSLRKEILEGVLSMSAER
ncbi:MAG: AmmeMemoRadiSam system protein B [Candidatus Moraniibacteriota bacterium]|nr:MAG: AmmeMemoRadiSam system protein B [Candidatus Moranbacteria bacterium]